MILTATEVTILSNISASVYTLINSTFIDEVQDNITMITNNYFTTNLHLQSGMTFNPSANTIIAQSSFETQNIASGDDIYIYNSYRNDGYKTIASVSGETITLTSACSVVDELSNRSILISVVKWPNIIKRIAAQMIAYDYDIRNRSDPNVKSFTLGPFSETYTVGDEDDFGYPRKLTQRLEKYTMIRVM